MGGRRIGLLGGTFDPIHAGHVDLATAAAAHLELDEVRFLTARLPPHKPGAHASGPDRHAMVALALADHDAFVPDPRELGRPGRSYTVETLRELRAELPEASLFFLAGADSLRDLSSWREPETILRLATFVAVGRAGESLAEAAVGHAEALRRGRLVLIDHEPPPWSSTELRALLRAGAAVPEPALAPPVARYLRKTGLYLPSDPRKPS